ncbi:unnamed protein product [Tuber aestivum]|uniref:Uncharacterized protein n=1 Tax=Tuber aestivum TaxID=59557 RepID=A0A292Q0S8_9PEZI|nr:unnamed protein product [Tuber aestivum]
MGYEGMPKILLDKAQEAGLGSGGYPTPLIAAIRSGHWTQSASYRIPEHVTLLDTPPHGTNAQGGGGGPQGKKLRRHRDPSANMYGAVSRKRLQTTPTLEQLENIAGILLKMPA